MGVGPIPWIAAREYAADHGITDPDDMADFWHVISALDTEYLAGVASKNKTENPNAIDNKPRRR